MLNKEKVRKKKKKKEATDAKSNEIRDPGQDLFTLFL